MYHKPTITDILILNNSFHHQTHKQAAFNSFIHRLLYILLDKSHFNNEIAIIQKLALNNGFNPSLIDNFFFNFDTFKLTNILQKYNLRVYLKKYNNIGNIFNNAKDKSNFIEKCGVYKLKCSQYNCFYLGGNREKP